MSDLRTSRASRALVGGLGLRTLEWLNHAPHEPCPIALVTLGQLWPLHAGATIRHAAVIDALTDTDGAAAVFVQRGEPSPVQREWASAQPIAIGWVRTSDVTLLGKAATALLALTRREPFHVSTMRLARLACGDFDIETIVAGQGAASGFVRPNERGRSLLCTLDFDPEYAANLAENATGRSARFVRLINAEFARRYYRSIYGQFRRVVAISREDAKQIEAVCPSAEITRVPLSLPHRHTVASPAPIERVVFVGSGERNLASITWTISRVLPLLRQGDVAMPYEIAGSFDERQLGAIDAARRDAGLPEDAVRTTGFVEDVSDVIAPGCLLLAPFERSAGVKVKCVDAMLRGALVATTPAGARGTPLRNGVNGIVESTPAALADSVLTAIREPKRATALAWKGLLDAVEEHGPGMYRSRWQALLR